MHLFQSSSFKLLCAMVMPALLVNALPQSPDKRMSQNNRTLTLHGNKEGNMDADIQTYPQVELSTLSSSPANEFQVVGGWTGDGNDGKRAAAYLEREADWSGMVSMFKDQGELLAAGKDDSHPPRWWVIVSMSEGIGFNGENLDEESDW